MFRGAQGAARASLGLKAQKSGGIMETASKGGTACGAWRRAVRGSDPGSGLRPDSWPALGT